jgi:hypothetical protein
MGMRFERVLKQFGSARVKTARVHGAVFTSFPPPNPSDGARSPGRNSCVTKGFSR